MSICGRPGKRQRNSTDDDDGEPQIDVVPSQRHVNIHASAASDAHSTVEHAGTGLVDAVVRTDIAMPLAPKLYGLIAVTTSARSTRLDGHASQAAGPAKTASSVPWSPHSLVDPTFRFTADKLARFEEQGYVVVPNFLSPSAVSHLRIEFDRVYSHLHRGVHDEWVLSAHQHVGRDELEWLWELATAPALLDALEAVLGTPNVVLFSTQLATKRPGEGTEVPWHQDGERCQTVWIPIDDVYVLLHQ